jgi:predicted aldo/keto reductase-like oxidoreductase
MSSKKKDLSRRDFLITAGAAGAGSILFPTSSNASELASSRETLQQTRVPTRPFGNTGVDVPILSFGGTIDLVSKQLLLRQALKWGVTYWDTAANYTRSEEGIGKYFGKNPEDRKKVFLVTKSAERDSFEMSIALENALKKMNTSYVDLYLVHMLGDIEDLFPYKPIIRWIEEMKKAGKIRFFGFSTHKNMEECMLGAAKLGWIDCIMMSYNYRLMHTDRMKAALDACVKAGIGLAAMKTQAEGQVKTNTEAELELAGRFVQKGFTGAQAALKAVWENPHIATICSQMPNLTILSANVAAALDKTKLTQLDKRLLEQHARETCSGYCAGCTWICEAEVDGRVPIGDVMRYLMYSRNYGGDALAKTLYSEIPSDVRKRISRLNYTKAEHKCPHKMEIGQLMREAVIELA